MFLWVVLLLAVAQTSASNESEINADDLNVNHGIAIGQIFLGVCNVVSVVTLLFTLVLYALGPDIGRVHGKCIIAFCLTLSSYFVCSAIEEFDPRFYSSHCFSLSIAGIFFCVASFCWLNVTAFDIWLSYKRSMDGRQNLCNSLWYFLFATISPGLFLALAVLLEYNARSLKKFDDRLCRHVDYFGMLGFFLFWLALVICSAVLLCCTYRRVKEEENRSNSVYRVQEGGQEPTSDHNRYVCYVNLYTVMAGNWIIFILLIFVSSALDKWLQSAWSPVVAYYARVLISLQGIAVFVACVWKTQYRAKLQCCRKSSYNVPQADNGTL